MVKCNLSAVFYSKGNFNKAYLLKKMFWKTKFQINNISEFSELIYSIQKNDVNLLIVDGETISLTEELLCVLKDRKLRKPDNILFVGYNKLDTFLEFDIFYHFIISYKELSKFFDSNYERLIFNVKKNSSNKFNFNFVNKFLTQYLISVGFLPKYVGFCYIKQCIEVALMNNGVLGSLSTQIYPLVAKRNRTNAVNIERNIRNSIECANKHAFVKDGALSDMTNDKNRISNRAFLSYLLDQVLISYKQLEKQLVED